MNLVWSLLQSPSFQGTIFTVLQFVATNFTIWNSVVTLQRGTIIVLYSIMLLYLHL